MRCRDVRRLELLRCQPANSVAELPGGKHLAFETPYKLLQYMQNAQISAILTWPVRQTDNMTLHLNMAPLYMYIHNLMST